MDDDAPGLWEVVSNFSLDPFWLALLMVLGVGYALLLRAARESYRGQRHPTWKITAFYAGLALLAAATVSPLEHYGNQALWVNFAGFLVLTMMAPPLLLLGSPLTLAFKASGPAWRRRLRTFYRGPLVRALTFPVVSWLAFAVLTYLWQWTNWTDVAATNALVRDVQLGSLLVVSICFWTPALCADPVRWRMAFPLRVLYVFLEMTHKGLFGGMFLSMNSAFHEEFAARAPGWAPTAITDQRMAILILWIGGNLIFLVALAGLIARWMRYEARNTVRTDRRLEKARAAERNRRAAIEAVFTKPL